jgi:CRP/FNR family transcriptional regulator, cyclic AMP receptor protein
MTVVDDQHVAWMARSFGRPDYLPLEPKDLEVLASVAEPITRFAGSHLFRQDEPAVAAYLIREGEVDLYRHRSGRRHVVARVRPGAVLGDIAMFGGGTYLSGARAVNHVRALRFERDTLLPELGRHPAICLRWLVAGQRQLEMAHRRIVQLMHGTVLARVAALLLDESPRPGRVRISQEEIAMLLGTTRQSVNEAVSALRRLGAVATSYRTIDVLDPERLRAAIHGQAA